MRAKLLPSKSVIAVNSTVCSGCRMCELVCSTIHDNESNPNFSRIQVKRNPLNGPDFVPQICLQCVEASCAKACPTGAIISDEKSGTNARIVEKTLCIGCRECIVACEAKIGSSRLRFDEQNNVAFKCDICEGEPQCVKYCPTGALTYVRLGTR